MELIIDSFRARDLQSFDFYFCKKPRSRADTIWKNIGATLQAKRVGSERGETREKIGTTLKSNLRPHTLRRHTSNHYTTEELEIHIPFRGVMFLSVK